MTEVQRKVSGRGGLIALIVVVVVLAVSNIWTYTNFQSQVASLQNQLGELNAIVELRKSQVLDKDKTVNLAARKDITLPYSTPYAGYITITFTASGGVYFQLGSSSLTGTEYAEYPSSGTATSGSFSIPVTKGTTYLYIRNPNLLLGASVTFTLTYVY